MSWRGFAPVAAMVTMGGSTGAGNVGLVGGSGADESLPPQDDIMIVNPIVTNEEEKLRDRYAMCRYIWCLAACRLKNRPKVGAMRPE